ncbi:hypothetical protein D3C71_2030950 [compost metagenome]
MRGVEIAYPDAFDQPLLAQFDQPSPGVDILVLLRPWPVDQIQIDVIQLEFFQAGFQRALRVALIVVPQFGGDKQLIAWY